MVFQFNKAIIPRAAIAAVIVTAALIPGSARGQNRFPAAAAAKKYYNQTFFHLPILLKKDDRPLIKQVVLYVKIDGGPWQKNQVAPPTQRFFSFRAPRDGVYDFSVVTVDRQGNATPDDVNREPPVLTVVVDTQPPNVELTPMRLANGQQAVRCRIADRSPDYNKLCLTLKSGRSGPVPLQRVAGSHNLFQFPSRLAATGEIQCNVTDAAGNVRTQTVGVNRLFPGLAAAKQSTGGGIVPASAQTRIVKRTNLAQTPIVPASPPLPPPASEQKKKPASGKKPTPQSGGPGPLPPPPNAGEGRADFMKPNRAVAPPPNRFPMANTGSPVVATPSPPSARPTPQLPSPDAGNVQLPGAIGSAGGPAATDSGSLHLLTTPRASIQYRIDNMGASGISKVDIYVKEENSPSWKHVGVDRDRTSPAEVTLPGDGIFGVRLVVTNGHGIGGQAPAANEKPDFRIEVDSTPPFAKLHPIDPLTGSGAIEIRWTASDRNLGEEAVALFYANEPQGPWHSIVRRHKNSGKYLWRFPLDRGSQFFLKLEVTDIAGNKTAAVTQSPVVLDMTRPHVSVVGVVGVSPGTR